MLVEEFIASLGPISVPSPALAKDAAIFIYEFQPLVAQRAVFKNSATLPQCLAVGRTHVFAAQANKAVVQVYSKGKAAIEATVPFQEKISAIALACGDAVLAIGTVEGRIILWEINSGRQITTTNSHLQPITSIAIDADSHHMLTASADSTVHIWSLPALLSFSSMNPGVSSPLRTFSGHRAQIVALTLGHSRSFCNIVVSAAKDKTCLIWDLHTANLLRTFLLPSVPSCLTFDPADRAVYVGYEDGTLQQVDVFTSTLIDGSSSDAVQNATDPTRPIQPSRKSLWSYSDASNGPVRSIVLSFDGSIVLTGHETGQILSWEVGRGAFRSALLQQPLPGPVTNLSFLPIKNSSRPEIVSGPVSSEIVKPKFGIFDTSADAVPGNYAVKTQLREVAESTGDTSYASFLASLSVPAYSESMVDQGLGELIALTQGIVATDNRSDVAANDDEDNYIVLDDATVKADHKVALEQENERLRQQLDALRNLQKVSFAKIRVLHAEKQALLLKEEKRALKQPTTSSDGESE